MSALAPTLDEQIAAVQREIALRQRVYPRWVETGRMAKAQAEHEMACMKAVLGTLLGQKAMSPPRVR